ncbi:MAG TPA: PASTA domain-containing protein [Bacteroidia bacterium]|nr:PASTA domain-containing protein [Bacteroidia bacterium]
MNSSVIKIYALHFVGAVISVFLFLWFISYYLDTYTNHNKYIATPDVIKLPINEASKIITSKKLRFLIIDSIYKPEEKPGIVISQNPDPNTNVKENRTIYLTVTTYLPPSVQMPKLIDLSERQATMILSSYDLKLGKIIYEPSYCNGCVINQLYKNKPIEPGTYIKKGSVIDIVVGTKGAINSPQVNDTINSDENPLDKLN